MDFKGVRGASRGYIREPSCEVRKDAALFCSLRFTPHTSRSLYLTTFNVGLPRFTSVVELLAPSAGG